MSVHEDSTMHTADDDEFAALMAASSLRAPHVRTLGAPVPDGVRRRLHAAADAAGHASGTDVPGPASSGESCGEVADDGCDDPAEDDDAPAPAPSAEQGQEAAPRYAWVLAALLGGLGAHGAGLPGPAAPGFPVLPAAPRTDPVAPASPRTLHRVARAAGYVLPLLSCPRTIGFRTQSPGEAAVRALAGRALDLLAGSSGASDAGMRPDLLAYALVVSDARTHLPPWASLLFAAPGDGAVPPRVAWLSDRWLHETVPSGGPDRAVRPTEEAPDASPAASDRAVLLRCVGRFARGPVFCLPTRTDPAGSRQSWWWSYLLSRPAAPWWEREARSAGRVGRPSCAAAFRAPDTAAERHGVIAAGRMTDLLHVPARTGRPLWPTILGTEPSAPPAPVSDDCPHELWHWLLREAAGRTGAGEQTRRTPGGAEEPAAGPSSPDTLLTPVRLLVAADLAVDLDARRRRAIPTQPPPPPDPNAYETAPGIALLLPKDHGGTDCGQRARADAGHGVPRRWSRKEGEEAEQHAHLWMSLHQVEGDRGERLPVRLVHRASDPYAITAVFNPGTDEEQEWTFARELLSDGMHHSVGIGDVIVWPGTDRTGAGRRVYLRLRPPEGTALLSMAAEDLAALLDSSVPDDPGTPDDTETGILSAWERELRELSCPSAGE